LPVEPVCCTAPAARERLPGQKSLREKSKFVRHFKADSAVQSLAQNILLPFFRIMGMLPASRLDARGTFWPIVTGREAGCDGRKGAARDRFVRTNGAAADGEVVWS
jgi:hypothetical protein